MKIVSGKRIRELVENKGWAFVRTTGSHQIYRTPQHFKDQRTISIPIHGNKDLKRGTQARLMKQAKIEDSEL